MSICCIQMCPHYLNKCSVRVCFGLLPPALNAVAKIVAETGSAVSRREGGCQLGLQEAVWTLILPVCFKLTQRYTQLRPLPLQPEQSMAIRTTIIHQCWLE